jgi:hypothetical protein
MRGEFRDLVGRPRRRWKDTIKIDIQEVGWGIMEWIALAHDRERWRALLNAGMNFRVAQHVGNSLAGFGPVSLLRVTLHHGVS